MNKDERGEEQEQETRSPLWTLAETQFPSNGSPISMMVQVAQVPPIRAVRWTRKEGRQKPEKRCASSQDSGDAVRIKRIFIGEDGSTAELPRMSKNEEEDGNRNGYETSPLPQNSRDTVSIERFSIDNAD